MSAAPDLSASSGAGIDLEALVDAVRDVAGAGPAALHEPEFGGRERDYVMDCIDSGWVSSVGAYVDRFEAMLAEAAGTRFAVATVNGTAALHMALKVAGVEPGDEVLVPALTFVATANAVVHAGATPHLVDCGCNDPRLDVAALAAYLEDIAERRDGRSVNRRTDAVIRAVVPMHIFGHPVDMDELTALARRWGLVVVEDSAEALGSTYRGRRCGGLGDCGIFSFNGNKVVTTGGGGAILTDDPDMAARAKHLTTTARTGRGWSFVHDEVGYNYRLPNINAALGCAQLEQLDGFLARKRELAERYIARFASVAGATIWREPEGTRSNYWLVSLLLDSDDEVALDAALGALNDAGFGARPVWTPMHRLPMFAGCPQMALANADSIARRLISLPSSPVLAT